MHQQIIDLGQWADLFERLAGRHQTRAGSIDVTVGTHPDIGGLIAEQDPAYDTVLVRSEWPLSIAFAMGCHGIP